MMQRLVTNLIRSCSVHFIRSAMRVAKLVNISTTSLGYQMFMSVVNLSPTIHPKIELL